MGTGNMVVDTNVFIDFLRAKNKQKTVLYSFADSGSLFISAVKLYELHMGATTEEKKQDIHLLVDGITVLPFNEDVAKQPAEIYHGLKKANNIIEFRDIFIAATCLVYNMPLITINKKHFSRIKELELVR